MLFSSDQNLAGSIKRITYRLYALPAISVESTGPLTGYATVRRSSGSTKDGATIVLVRVALVALSGVRIMVATV